MFLGTPHRGSNLATIGSIVGKIINIGNLGLGGAIVKTNLLDSISYDSRSLQDLEVSVRNRLHDLAVVSFYETQTMPKLSTLVKNAFPAFASLCFICTNPLTPE